ncbi:hypothetical protein PV08_01174 [Exophiala spinifera]|uniref:Beta-lactamase-related domain-containing protein n=1 Tax=Exophiala spinifera TaxID=91928 RepID=A0A0D2CAK4_9EURO|nr:uncharacterized protein PV08_01174 [Exophiala spinifera]KIW20599.1 hypothetical protein PV08_01174 [Exophiala spinifera]
MARIAAQAIPSLKSQIDALTSDATGAPGVVFAAVNKQGESIFEHASGTVGVGKSQAMTMDNVFWIASCTKMITGIACMQLVEQGKLALDDVALVEKLAPVTGFAYAFFDDRINDWAGPLGIDEFSGSYHDYLSQPLVNQPGEVWEYGINIDWAGQLVERASGLKLNDYFQQHIFGPMGLKHISMFPSDSMRADLAYMNARAPDGTLSLNPDGHLNRRPLFAKTKEEIDTTFHAGGAGCFARPTDYAQIIATVLNDGVHPGTGATILKKETVDTMFTNQIPEMPNFGRQAITPPKPMYANALPELYPEPHDIPQGWGLTFFLHLRESAVHSEGTGWWAGHINNICVSQ